MNEEKIEAQVAALKKDEPFLACDAYLSRLDADPTWTYAEILRVQSRVIGALLNQLESVE